MHELGLVTRVVETLRASAAEQGVTKVRKVHLVVGKRSGVSVPALRFAFEVLAGRGPGRSHDEGEQDTDGADRLLHGAELDVEEVPVRLSCGRCGLEATEDETGGEWPLVGPCPACGSLDWRLLSGAEFVLDYYEGD